MTQLSIFGSALADAPAQTAASERVPVLARASERLTLPEQRQRFERLLRERHIPYVAVDEARKAIFRDAKLKTFDFITYGAAENWLVCIGEPRRETREGMHRWQDVFGEGCRAVFAFYHERKGLRIVSLAGALLCGGSDLPAVLSADGSSGLADGSGRSRSAQSATPDDSGGSGGLKHPLPAADGAEGSK